MRFVAEQVVNGSVEESETTRVLSRWRHEVQIAILRRRAAMTRAVLPKPSKLATWLITGDADGIPSSERRAPPLSAVAEEEGDASLDSSNADTAPQDEEEVSQAAEANEDVEM